MIFKVNIESQFGANRWLNTLYYRNANPLLNKFVDRGAAELAKFVEDNVVNRLIGVYNTGTSVNYVRVSVLHDDFSLFSHLPHERAVGKTGEYRWGEWLPPSQGLYIKFALEPVADFPLVQQPKRGRIFISGLTEAWFNCGLLVESLGDELVPGSLRSRLRALCNSLKSVLSHPLVPDPIEIGEFIPIRAKHSKFLGFWRMVGWSDIKAADYTTRVFYLRERDE